MKKARKENLGHCNKCERTWKSKVECHCSGCCNHFSRVSVFDKHRVAGNCLDFYEMTAKKLVYHQDRNIWTGAALPNGHIYKQVKAK